MSPMSSYSVTSAVRDEIKALDLSPLKEQEHSEVRSLLYKYSSVISARERDSLYLI